MAVQALRLRCQFREPYSGLKTIAMIFQDCAVKAVDWLRILKPRSGVLFPTLAHTQVSSLPQHAEEPLSTPARVLAALPQRVGHEQNVPLVHVASDERAVEVRFASERFSPQRQLKTEPSSGCPAISPPSSRRCPESIARGRRESIPVSGTPLDEKRNGRRGHRGANSETRCGAHLNPSCRSDVGPESFRLETRFPT